MDDGPSERIEYRLDWEKLMSTLRERAADVYGHSPSLREMADYVGVSAATLSRVDRGFILDIKTLTDICATIDAPPGQFFERRVWVVKETT